MSNRIKGIYFVNKNNVTKDVRLLRDASSLRILIALSLHLVHQVLPNIISISD